MNKYPLVDIFTNKPVVVTPHTTGRLSSIVYTKCPKCKSDPNFYCETTKGRCATKPHAERVDAFVFMTGK